MYYEPGFFPKPFTGKNDDPPAKRWGIFGRVNVSTQFKEITDGLSNTLMIGELQRITDLTPTSKDGWAIGGPATLFTTGAMFRPQRQHGCAGGLGQGRRVADEQRLFRLARQRSRGAGPISASATAR